MLVRFLVDIPVYLDGMHARFFRAGEEADLPPALASSLLVGNIVEEVKYQEVEDEKQKEESEEEKEINRIKKKTQRTEK